MPSRRSGPRVDEDDLGRALLDLDQSLNDLHDREYDEGPEPEPDIGDINDAMGWMESLGG